MARSRQESLRERKRQLALSIDASRHQLTSDARDLRAGLNPVRGLSSYLRRHPLRVFGTTTLGVAALTWICRTRRRSDTPKPKRKRSLLLRLTLKLAKPAIRVWFLNRTRNYFQNRFPGSVLDSLLGH